MTRLASPPADSVSEALRSLGVRSSIFCLSELHAPWAFRVEGEAVAKFHLVLEGSAFLFCDSDDPVALGAGDLVVLPRGAAHTLAADRTSPVVALEHLLAESSPAAPRRLRHGGAGAVTRLLCGGFSLAERRPGSALSLFPEVLRVGRDEAGATRWLEHVLATLSAEAADGLPGASAILAKIADVFLAQALRVWLIDAETSGRLRARVLDNQPIAKAVSALNDRPSEAWSLDRLARHVGLSRTALALKFRELIGEPPMRYLTKLRLGQAAGHLSTGHLTIHEIARLTGYRNDATLSKAFKREFGQSPGAYRESERLPVQIEIV